MIGISILWIIKKEYSVVSRKYLSYRGVFILEKGRKEGRRYYRVWEVFCRILGLRRLKFGDGIIR